mmetsp:Transcript_16133/g.47059  ORF Transcript_16133/g.47059 Transcript_16133/m.47059 type:complete len:312 (+) Transcript_16133:459-1394(+)
MTEPRRWRTRGDAQWRDARAASRQRPSALMVLARALVLALLLAALAGGLRTRCFRGLRGGAHLLGGASGSVHRLGVSSLGVGRRHVHRRRSRRRGRRRELRLLRGGGRGSGHGNRRRWRRWRLGRGGLRVLQSAAGWTGRSGGGRGGWWRHLNRGGLGRLARVSALWCARFGGPSALRHRTFHPLCGFLALPRHLAILVQKLRAQHLHERLGGVHAARKLVHLGVPRVEFGEQLPLLLDEPLHARRGSGCCRCLVYLGCHLGAGVLAQRLGTIKFEEGEDRAQHFVTNFRIRKNRAQPVLQALAAGEDVGV